jgi:molecular chaperone DnaJ
VARERKLTVKIPAGIATGQRMRLVGEGEHGGPGAPPGDLYVVVHVAEHSFFKRDGDDLYGEVTASYPCLVLGGRLKVPSLDGEQNLDVPAGTASGTAFRLKGQGMPNVSGRGRGDLYVQVRVDVPRKLTREQRKLVEALGQTMDSEHAERVERDADAEKPFFERVKDIFG